jgi:photosystem II stability/assembly factor-like uncharacterized protein
MKKITIFLLCLFCFQTARAEWVKQTSETMAWLRSVYFVNEKTGWIGGSGGTLMETTDGGKYWSRLRNFTSDTIRQIYFSDEKNGWILCEKSAFGLGANPPSYLMKTNNGGISWEQINFTGGRRERIADVFFTKNGLGFAVGEAGAFFALQPDAKTWKKQSPPIHFLMLDGAFADDYNGAIVGAGGSILFTDNAGMSWTRANVQGEPKTKLNSVYFINQKYGWAVGAEGKIFQTINGGRFWREQKTGVEVELNDVFFLDTAEGWAIGAGGVILHTTTGGNVWTIKNSKVGHRLEKLFFAGKSGWAVGFGGTILRYDDRKGNLSESALVQPD